MSLSSRTILIWVLFIFLVPISTFGSFTALQARLVFDAPQITRNIQPIVHFVAKKTHSPARKTQKSTSSLIQNIRFHKHTNRTRLVIDLTGASNYSTRKDKKHNQVILELKNTRLSKRAYRTTLQKGFPNTVQVSREWGKPVIITINRGALSKYTVLTLTKPNRLVLDLFPSSTPPKVVKKIPSKPKAVPPKVVKKVPPKAKTPPKVIKKKQAKPKTTSRKIEKKIPTKLKTAPPTIVKKKQIKPKVIQPVTAPKPTKPGNKLLIVIDPGHGGKDPGALGRKGTREKDIVLKVSHLLRTMIQERLNANVLMTREKDVFIELEDRAKLANKKKADLFISIHVNSHPKRSVKGLELYHFGEASDPRAMEVAARENGTPLKDNGPAWQFILADKLTDKKIENSRDLAWIARKALVGQLRKHYKIKDHGVKTAPFFVLRMTTMPGILAEIAFVSNPTEEKLLTSKTYQKRTAEGIFKGIKSYISPLQTVSR